MIGRAENYVWTYALTTEVFKRVSADHLRSQGFEIWFEVAEVEPISEAQPKSNSRLDNSRLGSLESPGTNL